MAVSDYSTTANDNTTLSGSAVTDATVVDTVDNLIRQLMADTKGFYDDVRDGSVFSSVEAAVRTALQTPYFYQGTFTGDLQALSSAAGVTIARIASGVSNGWSGAGDDDYVVDLRDDANNAFQLGFSGDGTLWRNVEISGVWSSWQPFLNQSQVIGNDTDDLGASQALKLVAYGVVSSVTSGSFTVAYDEGCTATYGGTGTVAVAFDNTRPAATYIVQATSEGDDDFVIVRNKSTSGFDIIGKDLTTGTTVDFGGVTFMVYEKRS